MRKIVGLGLMMVAVAGLVSARAEDIVLFDAKAAGPDVWTWEGARIIGQGDGRLILSPDKAGSPAVFLEDRFAYIPDGVIEAAVGSVPAGTYAVQVLAFQGNVYVGAVDLLKDATDTGVRTIKLRDLNLPAGTETIAFKLWISREIGASVVINNLRYFVPVAADKVVFNRQADSMLLATPEQAVWTAAAEGAVITLEEGKTYGSVLLPDFIEKPEKGTFILQLGNVKNGSVTAQAYAFDAERNYLDALDVVKAATSDASAPLDRLTWPEGTASFQIKLWLGGGADASAIVKRIVVLK